jgi:hypothetical protein
METPHVFECPRCGGNLNDDNGGQATVTCPFCGQVVEVPRSLREDEDDDQGYQQDDTGLDLEWLLDHARELLEKETGPQRHARGGVPPVSPADEAVLDKLKAVTTLGPLTALFAPNPNPPQAPAASIPKAHAGLLQSLFHGKPTPPAQAQPLHAAALAVFQDGLAFTLPGDPDVHAWRFDEVTTIQSNLYEPQHAPVIKEFTLTRASGETLVLNDALCAVEAAACFIKAGVFPRMVPPLLQRYEAGEALTFGPVTVHQRDGIQIESAHYAWDEIDRTFVGLGRFIVELRAGKSKSVRACEIPNLELLCRVIDLSIPEVILTLTYPDLG